MKSLIIFSACLTSLFAAEAPKVTPLKIGAQAPEFTLTGVDDKKHSLADFKDSKYLVMIFTCNHCPGARAAWGRMNSFAKAYVEKGVQVVAVSTNSPKALMPWENGFSVYGDSFSEMKQVAAERKFVFPYLYDGDTQEVGLAYGALATPHVFIFGPERKLLYQGHYDNGHRNPGPASKNTVRDNIDTLLAGKSIAKKKTKPFGCSTKWAYKQEWAEKKQKEWDALPVTVESLSLEKAKSLFKNESDRVRVINIWQTNSKLSIADFPKLIDTYRRYQRRPFDMVSIGVDPKDEMKTVTKIFTDQHFPIAPDSLKKVGRKTNNFHLQNKDLKTMAAWLKDGEAVGIPCTIVVAPGGKILYRKELDVDAVELRRAIVKGLEALKKK